jgi:membrane protease YdiL (CAAX protease family)
MKLQRTFLGEGGLRSGWRLLIWLAIALGLTLGIQFAVVKLFHPGEHPFLDPRWLGGADVAQLIPVMIATLVMAHFERRPLRYYYIPGRDLLGRHFWVGAGWGFGAVSLLIGLVAVLGYRIEGLALHGATVVPWTLMWLLAALAIGVVEEITFRAYLLRTLSDGIGFWLAAAVLSLLFGALHYFTKPYERWEDFACTGLLGLFICMSVRRMGTLSFAMGFHMAFDWGAMFIYSGRNAGEFAVGKLLHTSWPGPQWLTGGMLGPEASRLVFVVIAALFGLFAMRYSAARTSQ